MAHDAVSDDGTTVVCECGRTWDGPKARDQHIAHLKVQELRAVLAAAAKENDGS